MISLWIDCLVETFSVLSLAFIASSLWVTNENKFFFPNSAVWPTLFLFNVFFFLHLKELIYI